MAVVGSAYVIVRAISKSLKKDIGDGVKDGVKDALPGIDKATKQIGDKIGDNVQKGVKDIEAKVAPEARKAGDKLSDGVAERFAGIDRKIGSKFSPAMNKVGANLAPTARRVGDKLQSELATSFGRPLSKEMHRKVNDALIIGGRHLLPDVGNLGHLLGTEFMESFVVEIPDTVRRRGNFVTRTVRASFRKVFSKIRADKDGENIGNRLIKGFTGMLDKFKIPPIVWIGFFGIGAIGGILKILAAYVASAVSLVSALGPALGAAGLAGAAGIATLGAAFAVLKIAFGGGKKGATAELKKFKAILKDINDKDFAPVRKAVQQALFPKLTDALDNLTKLFPTLKAGLPVVADSIGDLALNLSKTLTSKGNIQSLNAIFAGTPAVLKPLGSALGSIVSIFLDLAEAGQPLLAQFAQFTAEWLKGKQAALDAAEASGKLDAFIERSGRVARQVGRIMGNVGRGIAGIFKAAAPTGSDYLDSIEKITAKFDKWVNSDYGQSKLAKFFSESREIVREVNGLIGDMLKALGKPMASGNSDNLKNFISTLRTDVLPALQDIAQQASALAPKLIPLLKTTADILKDLNESGSLGKFFDTLKLALDIFNNLLKTPVVGTLIKWGIAFLGVAKAVNFILKPIGGLKTILGPLGRLLFGTKDKTGLLAKAFERLSKTKVGTFFKNIKDGVKGIGSKLWSGAATAIKKASGAVGRAIAGLAKGIGRAVGSMLTRAAKFIPWGNLFKGAGPKIGAAFGGAVAGGIGKFSWSAALKGVGTKFLGAFGAALTISDIGHFFKPFIDNIVFWIHDHLPEPLKGAFAGAMAVVWNSPIWKAATSGSEKLLDDMWPDHWPWEDNPPPPVDGTKLKQSLDAMGSGVATAVGIIGQKLGPLAGQFKTAYDNINARTNGALGQIVGVIRTKGREMFSQGSAAAKGVVGAFTSLFSGGKTGINNAVTTMLGGVVATAKSVLNPAPRAVASVMDATKRAIASARAGVNAAARTASNGVVPTVKQAVAGMKGAGASGGSSFARGIRDQVGAVQRAAARVRDAAHIKSFSLKSVGETVMGSFVTGLRARIDNVARAAIAATRAVLDNKGPIEYDRVMLTPAGIATMQGYIDGIRAGFDKHVKPGLKAITAEVPGLMTVDPRDQMLGIAPPGGVRPAAAVAGGTVVHATVYNPVAEKTSQTLTKKNTKIARTGAFG